jgi:hypothetical protein
LKQIRKRWTYANVMSSIAVFLILGGATAFAAAKLGKNTVGTKQLKNNAVTTKKIKNGAVTTAKLKDGAVTGAKVNLGSLGKVPSAASADNATNATNAGTVNGQSVSKIFKTLNAGESNVVVASIAGFTITASCESSNIDVKLTTPNAPASVASVEGNGSPEGAIFDYDSEESGTPSEIALDDEPGVDNTYGQSDFSAAMSNGQVISGVVGYDYDTFANNPPNVCIVFGHATVG